MKKGDQQKAVEAIIAMVQSGRLIQKENVVVKFEEFLRTERVVAQYGNDQKRFKNL